MSAPRAAPCATATCPARGCDRADLTGCDLRGSELAGIDPTTVTLDRAIITLPQAVTIVEAMGLDLRVD